MHTRQKQRFTLGHVANAAQYGLIEQDLSNRDIVLTNRFDDPLCGTLGRHDIRAERVQLALQTVSVEHTEDLPVDVADGRVANLQGQPHFRRQKQRSPFDDAPPSPHQKVILQEPPGGELDEDLLAFTEDAADI